MSTFIDKFTIFIMLYVKIFMRKCIIIFYFPVRSMNFNSFNKI